jgi:putative tricarboxylic transport membrane protein
VPGRLGPDAWPKIVLGLLIVTCVIGLVNAFRQPAPPLPAAEPAAPDNAPRALLPSEMELQEPQGPSRYGLVAAGFALFLIYPVALEYLGFLLATFLLMTIFMLVGQWWQPLPVLVTAALGTLVLFYVFRGVVYVSLPLGVGPFHDWTVWVADLLRMR